MTALGIPRFRPWNFGLALTIGLVVVNVVRPGAGVNADVSTLDTKAIESYATSAKSLSTVDMLLHIIPESAVGAFAGGEILQVLLFSVLFGLALARLGENGRKLIDLIDQLSHVLFNVIGIIMRVAPLGAFGAMAFTIGKYGVGTLADLAKLMACVYLTCVLFVAVVLGTIARLVGFRLWPFLKYIKEEILIVLGTSSSEAVLPRMIIKMENVGCAKPVVGLVIPTGYSFNLDGTSIYLTMAAMFIAQATNVPLNLWQQLSILGVLLLTSKGAAAVTGGGFITLAATLSSTGTVPVAGLALILGIDRFMSEARAITNLIGNGVATMVVARWEGRWTWSAPGRCWRRDRRRWPRSRKPWPTPWPRACPWCPSSPFRSQGGKLQVREGKGDVTDIDRSRGEGASRTCT